jgi:double zinc ribbon protein/adenylate/guanylate cyclase family protein
MNCPRCECDTPSDAEFCPQCGAKLIVACAQCGVENAPQHRFCKKCGQPLVLPGGHRSGAMPRLAPDAYTPKHLAERIFTSRSALEGERKQVTVLFADLKGSMELLADRDPEDARKFLAPVLDHMMEAVHRYEGTVNQVMGDGIMALFGAPLALEDHAVRACYAALRMHERRSTSVRPGSIDTSSAATPWSDRISLPGVLSPFSWEPTPHERRSERTQRGRRRWCGEDGSVAINGCPSLLFSADPIREE